MHRHSDSEKEVKGLYAKMGSLSDCNGAFGPFVTHEPLYVPLSVTKLCFQGDQGPKGACGGDGPKGEKVRLRQTYKM